MAIRQRVVCGDEITHVVLDRGWKVVAPVEKFLEYLRQDGYSPHTVRSYAGGLAAWWSFLEAQERGWERVTVDDLVRFRRRLRAGEPGSSVITLRPATPVPASTIDAAMTAVMSFYRFFAVVGGIPAARQFYIQVKGGSLEARGKYASLLGHIGGRQDRRVLGRRRDPRALPPFLTPRQISVIKDDAAMMGPGGVWDGDLRFRLFWALLEATGFRLAEALLLQHRDWLPGTGTTAVIEVQPREDIARRLRVKYQQYRRLYVSDDLDDLYAEYLFWLTDHGVDFDDETPVFVNLFRGRVGAPMRPETVYDWIEGFKRRHPLFPPGWTPHWFRHTHATAMLLAGVPAHVVQRRLGHRDINTLLTTYAHVSDDSSMKAAADWKSLVARWKAEE